VASQSRNHPHAGGMARRLRREATPAERALWRELRKLDGPRWRRQAPIGPRIVDFACLPARLVVEIDGGAHNAPDVALRDAKKQAWLEAEGFVVARFSNQDVLGDATGVAVKLQAMASTRLPAPSRGRAGGGGTVDRPATHVELASPVERPAPPPPAPPREGAGRRPSRRSQYVFAEASVVEVDPAALVLVGAIAGAFGVRGEVKVRTFTAEPEGVVAYGPLYDTRGKVVLTPKRWRPIKDGLAITAPEVADREAAEALRNTALHVQRAALPPAEDDEFYHVDLIGCRVETVTGEPLGEVVAVHDFGAGDVLELRDPAGARRYVEFSRESVPLVDLDARRLVAALTPADGEAP